MKVKFRPLNLLTINQNFKKINSLIKSNFVGGGEVKNLKII